MSNKSESDLRRLLFFGLVAGLAAVACRTSGWSPASKDKAPSRAFRAGDAGDEPTEARGQARDEATRSSARVAILQRPRLLPRLDAVEPAFIDFESPDVIVMAVDGIRFALHSSGSFEIAEGTLPIARHLTAMRLPPRLGAGWLFCLASSENTWLMRSDSFTGRLIAIGNIEVPTSAVTPGFEGIYVTLRQSGLVISVDPKTGKSSESEMLPHAPEYGPIAIVSDQMGAYVDPLRGIMTTLDAGRNWRPLDWARVAEAMPVGTSVTPSTPILNLTSDTGELRVDLTDQHFWLSSSGNVHFAREAANTSQPRKGAASASFFGRFAPRSSSNESPSNDAPSPSRVVGERAGGSRVVADSSGARLRLRQWLDAWQRGPLGGWPIEVAVTRGAMLEHRTALVLAKGRLSTLRLRDGRVIESQRVAVPVDVRCEALEADRELFFSCERARSTSIYHLRDRSRLEALAMFVRERDVIAYSDPGVIVRGTCAANAQPDPNAYCVVQPGVGRLDVRLLGATGRERLVTTERNELSVLLPPDATSSGRLIRVRPDAPGRSLHLDLRQPSSSAVVVALTEAAPVSGSERAMLRDSLWLQRLHYASGELSAWLTKGDDWLGVHIDRAGKLTHGEMIAGATRAIDAGDHVLLPDSSGFAFESSDAGMTYRRPRLPLAVADVDAAIPHRERVYGCT
ncbi:MAG TPA: hypothetical protein VIV60_14550, partial [Polyangiaceae bacterium]